MKKNDFLRKVLKKLAITAVWLIIWLAAAKAVGLELLLPSPEAVVKAFAEIASQKSFYVSCALSLLKVVAGWLAGLFAGIILSVLTGFSAVLKEFFAPALHIIKATPVASFIVLALVLMSASRVPVFTGFLIVLPVVWANMSEGIAKTDPKLLEMANAFGMSKTNKLLDIYIPSLRPYFSAAATTSMGFAWKACIAAEVICSPKNSIGSGIYNAKIYLETPSLFAWTLTVILLSVALEGLIHLILRKTEAKA